MIVVGIRDREGKITTSKSEKLDKDRNLVPTEVSWEGKESQFSLLRPTTWFK